MSITYSSAQFKEYPDGSPILYPKTKHVLEKNADRAISRLNPLSHLKFASSKSICRWDAKSTPYSVVDSTPSYDDNKKSKCSYQLQRYLEEPAGYGATLFIGASPTQRCMDLPDINRRSEKKDKKRRKAAMAKKIRAIERKIGEL
jgi:hypothetical protein